MTGGRLRKIIALIFGGVYFIIIVWLCEIACILQMSAGLAIVLSFIWFSEEWGYYTGFIGVFQPRITTRSPGWLVELMGWLILLMPAVLFLYRMAYDWLTVG